MLREKQPIWLTLLPTTISLTRAALALVFYNLLILESPFLIPTYLIICTSDVLDGWLARFLNASSNSGVLIDASADFLVLGLGFFHYADLGFLSFLLLFLMSASFIQYVITLKSPICDPLGKFVGTVLYILLALTMLFPNEPTRFIITVVGVIYVSASVVSRLNRLIICNQRSRAQAL